MEALTDESELVGGRESAELGKVVAPTRGVVDLTLFDAPGRVMEREVFAAEAEDWMLVAREARLLDKELASEEPSENAELASENAELAREGASLRTDEKSDAAALRAELTSEGDSAQVVHGSPGLKFYKRGHTILGVNASGQRGEQSE